jgi:hypothetical protein
VRALTCTIQINEVLELNRGMNNIQLLTIVVVTAMLVTSAVLATENAYAKYKGKSQASSQANACGNGKLPMNVLCSNVGSQVQGEDNVVSLASAQEGGEFEPIKKDKDHGEDKDHGKNGEPR